MGIKVCKFGGTSMADGNIIQSAAKIVAADPARRYVVVSAPGKRFGGDIKVTDLLYKCSELAETGGAFEAEFSKIRTRFLNIEKEIGLDLGVEGMLDEIEVPVNVVFYQVVDGKEIDIKYVEEYKLYASQKTISKKLADELAGDWCTVVGEGPFTINWSKNEVRIEAKRN